MDKKIRALWENSSYPFNQSTIYLDDLIKITELLSCLQRIVVFLKEIFHDDKIYLNHDWHEHDGFINNSTYYQCSLLDNFNYEKDREINKTVDVIRLKYGSGAIVKSRF